MIVLFWLYQNNVAGEKNDTNTANGNECNEKKFDAFLFNWIQRNGEILRVKKISIIKCL